MEEPSLKKERKDKLEEQEIVSSMDNLDPINVIP
jgi:hypothetical protein